MALQITLPDDRGDDAAYWLIDRLIYDKDTNTTTAEFSGYPSHDKREAKFPVAYARKRVSITGIVDLAGAYDYAKTNDGSPFKGATDV